MNAFNSDRALELVARMRLAALDAIAARDAFRDARNRRRETLAALRDARRALNGFLEGKDTASNLSLPFSSNGNGAAHH